MSLLDIPTVLLCEILSVWLDIQELGRIDSALCHAHHRATFLSAIGHSHFLCMGNPNRSIDDGQLLWLFKRNVHLQSLCVRDPDVNLSPVECQVFERLEYLDIYYRNRLRIIMEASFANLKVIVLRGYETMFPEALVAALQCSKLHTLEIAEFSKLLDGKKLKNYQGFTMISPNVVKCNESLRSLVCNWPAMSLRHLHTVLSGCSNITRLELNISHLNDETIYSIVASCPNLSIIKLIKCGCTTNEGIVALANLTALQVLDLNGTNGVTNDTVGAIVSSNPNLRSVCVRFCGALTSVAVMKIATSCPDLTALDVAYCPFIKDDALLVVANKCRNLEDLQICGCEFITDTSMLRLANMCKRLTSINIKDCTNITKFTCDAFEFMGVKPYRRKLR